MVNKQRKIARTAPEALRILWKNKVFAKPKGVKEITAALEKKGYNFSDKNLMMALKSAKFLTRRGNEKNYSYVQKHPYIEEDNDGN